MGSIERPPKTGGTHRYQDEVAAGHVDIIDSEVDLDFDTIYDEFNGHITNVNVQGAAGIVRSKLDFGAGLVDVDIAVGAAIQWAKIAHPATFPPDVGPLGVTLADIQQGVIIATIGPTNPANTPLRVCGDVVLTSKGGHGFLIGYMSGDVTTLGGAAYVSSVITFDGTAGGTDGTPLDTSRSNLSSTAGTFPFSLQNILPFTGLTVGAHRFKQSVNGDNGFITLRNARVIVVEFN